MTFTLLVKAHAVEDISEAFTWYEQKRTGLGVEFLNEVEEVFGADNSKSRALSI